MNSSTRIEPGSETRRTSLRARSTSIVCSARSFPSASISPASRRSSTGLSPGTGARDRVRDDTVALHRHQRLGARADDTAVVVAQHVHVRRGVHLAQCRVQPERVDLAAELAAPRDHALINIAVKDVPFGGPHRLLVRLSGSADSSVTRIPSGVGGDASGARRRPAPPQRRGRRRRSRGRRRRRRSG